MLASPLKQEEASIWSAAGYLDLQIGGLQVQKISRVRRHLGGPGLVPVETTELQDDRMGARALRVLDTVDGAQDLLPIRPVARGDRLLQIELDGPGQIDDDLDASDEVTASELSSHVEFGEHLLSGCRIGCVLEFQQELPERLAEPLVEVVNDRPLRGVGQEVAANRVGHHTLL